MKTLPLEKCCLFILDGTHGSPVKTETGIPVLSAQNVFGGKLDYSTNRFTTTEEYNLFKRRLDVQKDDVLLTIVGTIGRVGIVNDVAPLVFQRSVAVFRTNTEILFPKFLYYALQHQSIKKQLVSGTNQSSQAGIYLGKLKKVEIPLPPLPEQKRIAEVLDKADALREKRRFTLQKLDTLLQSVFLEMFGDPVKNPKGWNKPQLKEIGKVTTGSTPSSELSNMFGGEIPFVTPGDLERANKQVSRTLTSEGGKQSRIVRNGSTLVCCIGATIGKVGKAFVPSAFNQQINAIEWNENINDDFGFHLLKFYKPIIAALGASTTLPILKKSSFEKIKFPAPPIDLQNKFSAIVEKIELLKSKETDSLEKAETLFQSLQQRAFKGELFNDEFPPVEPQAENVLRQGSLF